jgi:hypothetical protein
MRPQLLAEFELGKNGQPKTSWGKKFEHFHLRLFVRHPPPQTYSVTYQLHESYGKDRVREIPIGIPEFQEEITSYGDYDITVTFNGKSPQAIVTKLSEALRENYTGDATNEIQKAIKQIAEH